SSLDVAGLAHGTRRVSLEHLLNHHAADGLLGFAEDLAGLRMTKLSSFPIKGQLDSNHQAILAADPDRHGGPLYLDHVAVDLRKQGDDLIDQHTQGGLRLRLRRRRRGARHPDQESEHYRTGDKGVHVETTVNMDRG